jgi:hypothetical protein
MLIIIISLFVAFLFYILNNPNNETFTQQRGSLIENIKQCDFNDPKLSKNCKKIRDGCASLIKSEKVIKNDLVKKCDLAKDAKTARETISNKRDCVTNNERYIRTKYAKKELCAQIKNMPIDNNQLETEIEPFNRNMYSLFTGK